MKEISMHVGKRIRLYRKMKNMTIEVFAGLINKSKATVSKYENGDIAIDIETLFIIANALDISVNQLIDYDKEAEETETRVDLSGRRHGKTRMYLYFYDGRRSRIVRNVIDIRGTGENGMFSADLYADVDDYSNCYNVSIFIMALCGAMTHLPIFSLKTRITKWSGCFSTPSILSVLPDGCSACFQACPSNR